MPSTITSHQLLLKFLFFSHKCQMNEWICDAKIEKLDEEGQRRCAQIIAEIEKQANDDLQLQPGLHNLMQWIDSNDLKKVTTKALLTPPNHILPLISTTCMQIDEKAIVTRNSKESVEHFLSHSELAFDIGKNEIWMHKLFLEFNTENLRNSLSVGSQLQTLQAFSRANPSHLWKVESETKRGHVYRWLEVNKFVWSIHFNQLINRDPPSHD